MEYLAPVLIGLCLVNLVLTAILLLGSQRQFRDLLDKIGQINTQNYEQQNKTSEIIAQRLREINEAFSRNRLETDAVLKTVSEKMENLTNQNYRQQNKMLEDVTQRLKEVNESFLTQSRQTQETLSKSIDGIRESNEQKLEEMRKTVDEKLTATLKDRLDTSFKNVSQNLENVYKSLGEMKELAGGVSDLQRVLTNVKARGTWAEIQLGNILEQILTPDQYACNVSPKGNASFVEFAVKIPARDDPDRFVWLPIDSKFPQEDYLRLCDAAEKADREACEKHGKALERRIKEEAAAIRDLYIDVPATTDFGIMFLPTEGLYAEILRRPGLVEKIQSDYKVMICGPSTLTAFLSTIRMGFRTIAIDKRADEVWRVLGAAKSQYDMFEVILAKAKKKVDEASEALDGAQRRNTIIQRKLKGVEALEPDETLALLGVGPDQGDTEE